jgi:hypothetical protein
MGIIGGGDGRAGRSCSLGSWDVATVWKVPTPAAPSFLPDAAAEGRSRDRLEWG